MAIDASVVVVGAGQAGLATSYWLTERGIGHVVLDRGRVGDSWRARWDSFCLVTPNWTLNLPGFPYDGPEPDGFLPRDEIVAYLERYRDSFQPPIESPVEATSLSRVDGAWVTTTSDGEWRAEHVVVATGPFQVPFVPEGGRALSSDIFQVHSQHYRRPEDLPPGGVLVVGSGQSGCQIVDELHMAGRDVWLAVSRAGRAPRRHRGRDTVSWLFEVGMMSKPVTELPEGEAVRFRPNPHVSGRDGGKDLNLRAFGRDGVGLVGRFLGADGNSAMFADDLDQRLEEADEAATQLQEGIDEYIAASGIDAPPRDDEPVVWQPDASPQEVDLAAHGISSVVWATGYRLDFSWIDAPVFGERSYPVQQRGITDQPGLYFIGLVGLHALGSGLYLGVGDDARHIVDHITDQA